jgi:hypothetical protein
MSFLELRGGEDLVCISAYMALGFVLFCISQRCIPPFCFIVLVYLVSLHYIIFIIFVKDVLRASGFFM